jgi:site-specific DNA-methyltransferase (adenine-specific)
MKETNKIYQGDCLEVMKDIPDKSIDMILCDLPYGTTACKWDTIIPFEPLWEQYKRIIKDNGAIVLTASQPFTSALVMSNIKMFKYEWVWDRMQGSGFLNSKKRPLTRCENICVFSKSTLGNFTYNPQLTEKEKSKIRPIGKRIPCEKTTYGKHSSKLSIGYDKTKSYPTELLSISSKQKECNSLNRVHPTQKPVALFEYLIKTYTNEGDLVLDNCIGSGTTAVACINTNRRFIGIEISEEYCKIANGRLEELKSQVEKGEKL